MRNLTGGIVPEGDESHFVEMGERVSSTRPLKAEAAVLVAGALEADERPSPSSRNSIR